MIIHQVNNMNIDTLTIEAIQILKEFEPPEGYYLAFSGGKDSIVCYDLLLRSGVKFDCNYNSTTLDPPELLRFIKTNYPDTIWHYAKYMGKPVNFFQLIKRKGLPTRLSRWCCQVFKEDGGYGRLIVEGIRSAESLKRSKRKKFEYFLHRYYHAKFKGIDLDPDLLEKLLLKGKAKKIINIIFNWKDEDVWNYIKSNNLKYCVLYDRGYSRIGCIGCPMSYTETAIREFEEYPRFKLNILRVIETVINEGRYYQDFDSALDVFDWWVSRQSKKKWFASKNQYTINL